MLLNLSDVLSDQHRPINAAVPLEINTMKLPGGSYPLEERSNVQIHVEHVKGKEIAVSGNCSLTAVIPCDRCLSQVRVPMEISFEKRAIVGGEAEETDEASDYIDGYHLDVDKLLYYEILIGWPTKTLCREDCKGLCSVCGQNLNEGTCDCEDTGLDPRMSVIRDLFKNFKEV